MIIVKDKELIVVESRSSLLEIKRLLGSYSKLVEMNSIKSQALLTAATELVTNILKYADNGKVLVELVSGDGRSGVRASFEDAGPGIKSLEDALKEGFSSSNSMGNGLPGVKKLVDQFTIESEVGHGTKVVILQWR